MNFFSPTEVSSFRILIILRINLVILLLPISDSKAQKYFPSLCLWSFIFPNIFIYLLVHSDHSCLCAQSLQLNLTFCNPMVPSPPGSCVHGILQARILEWVACSSSGDFPHPGIEDLSPISPAFQADSLPLNHQRTPNYSWSTVNQSIMV